MWYDSLVPLLPISVAVIILCLFALLGTRNDSGDQHRGRR